MKNNITDIKKKFVKKTVLFIILIAVIVVAFFEINILVSKLNVSNIDLSSQKLYSITDETKDKLKSVKENVTIQLVNFENYSSISTIKDIEDLVNQYNRINSNITIEKKSDEKNSEAKMLIKYDEKQIDIDLDEILKYRFSSDTYVFEEYNICEEQITNAILNITNENNTIYLYMTHSAYSPAQFTTVINYFYNTKYINTAELEDIPSDCKCLIIPTVIEDITENEKNILNRYINNGGNILLLQESKTLINADMPNFKEVFEQYGFEISEGVVLESNPDNMIKSKPGYIITNYEIDENKNGKLCMIEPGIIKFKDSDTINSLGVEYQVITKAESTAFLRTNTKISDYGKTQADASADGAILGAIVNKKLSNGNSSKLIVYTNSIFSIDQQIAINDILTNEVIKVPVVNINDNEKALIESIKYLNNENELSYIRKPVYESVTVTKAIQDGFFVEIIFGLPMFIIFIGYIVWRARKNKK